MVNTYTINISNQTGKYRKYALFTAVPEVSGEVSPTIWTNVFATAEVGSGQATQIVVYKQFFAVLGNAKGTPAAGVTVKVSDTRDVNLGSQDDFGAKTPGTTVKMVANNHIPEFSTAKLTNAGYSGSFQFLTDDLFDYTEATEKNFMIGLGGSSAGPGYSGPSAVFIPEPSQKYQIKPKNIFYLTAGEYTEGTIIDVTQMTDTVLELDFSSLSGNPAKNVVHNKNGKLIVQV
ncbi:hypothetical protein BX600DRAFT_555921 [Xylariales sp. PMI_506]|nr:hypothetical protein BX600DRAFT_555921 [Xylariales sp. PMI_506]